MTRPMMARVVSRPVRVVLSLLVVGVVFLSVVPVALAGFGVHSFTFSATNRDGSLDVQAGSHPYELTASFTMNGPEPGSTLVDPNELLKEEDLKDTRVELPPGLVGDPDATPRCSYQVFISGRYACPSDTAVGFETAYVRTNESKLGVVGLIFTSNPIYNVQPPPGVAARFGFQLKGLVPVFLDVSVRTGGDYGLTVNTHNIIELEPIYGVTATFWGVPADSAHDALRGECLQEESAGASLGNCPVSAPQRPLLVNPTSCATPRDASISVDSWQQPGVFLAPVKAAMPELSGCERLDFSPSFVAAPQQRAASTPTGLDVDLHVPQESFVNPDGLVEANAKNTTVALPAGLDISPSAANGLLACSQAQLGLHDAAPSGCPEASKVASVEVTTPALPEPLLGGAYLAQQGNLPGNGDNPFGSLTALYIVAEDKQAGVLVKLAGEVSPDPVTGQLVTTFRETPQVPFTDFKLKFFGGPRASLSTPALCGTYTTHTMIEPWSGTGAVSPSSSFQITSGPNGGACRDPLPFNPGFTAGTINNQAGAFSPFSVTMTRPDGDQALGGTQIKTPPGLLGLLSSVKLCGEPQAAMGKCAPESQIGETTVSAGLGSEPVTVTGGKVYITGPYKGAPFGLSIAAPAVAGPFNLGPNGGGPVIVRAKIEVDPHTGALTVTSDPLPTVLQGIQLQLQRINVTINRPNFTFNPTNCEPLALTGTLSSDEDTASAPVSSPFQAANCASLPFNPSFTATTQGKTSKANGASLTVRVSQKPGEAHIHKVNLTLPLALPARLTTLQKACTEAQFNANPAGCPVASNIGSAIATTPVLNVPLTGPAYLVSHGGAAFPDVEFVLQGENVTIVLDGGTDIKKGITHSKFETVPDAPIATFETVLPEGPHSVLAAPGGSLCGQKLVIPTVITAQSNTIKTQNTIVKPTGCPKPHIKTKIKTRHHKLILTITTNQPGTITITSPLIKTTKKTLATNGTHKLTIPLTHNNKTHKHHTHIKITLTNTTGTTTTNTHT
jgi:hypothetical protein